MTKNQEQKNWDGRTDSNSRYFLLRRKGLSHSDAVNQITVKNKMDTCERCGEEYDPEEQLNHYSNMYFEECDAITTRELS